MYMVSKFDNEIKLIEEQWPTLKQGLINTFSKEGGDPDTENYMEAFKKFKTDMQELEIDILDNIEVDKLDIKKRNEYIKNIKNEINPLNKKMLNEKHLSLKTKPQKIQNYDVLSYQYLFMFFNVLGITSMSYFLFKQLKH